VKQKLVKILKNHIEDENFVIQKPKKAEYGHFAVPVFKYASQLKKNPAEYAKEIANELDSYEEFDKVEPIAGFVNFKLSDNMLDEMADLVLEKKLEFASSQKDESILLEYISANPTGPLHIGHARGAIFGDALLRIGRHLGYKIESEYYVNDAGNQIRLLGLSIFLAGREHLGLEVEWPEEFYRGEYIKDEAKRAIEEFGAEIFEDDSNIEKLSTWGKEQMLEVIKKDLEYLNVTKFDNFVSEKELYSNWENIQKRLEKNNALYEKDGKIWLKSSEKKDELDRVVVRENGIPTYLAGDIIYHDNKFQRKFDKYINIWGADHHGYIARVKAAIEFLGYDSKKLEVLLSQMVALLKGGEPYKMSKRAGNFILVRDVVEDIGADALRFVFLTKKSDTPLEFDVDELNKNDSSNPVFYVNYANARIHSIFRNANKTFEDVKNIKLQNLTEEEKDLLFFALQLPYELEDSFNHREPHRVTNFLNELASKIHKFYNNNKVLGDEKELIRLKLLAVCATIIKLGLHLLGIKVKDRM